MAPQYGRVLQNVSIHAMSAEDHARVFAGSAIKRATLPMLQRNATIVERNRANKDGAAS